MTTTTLHPNATTSTGGNGVTGAASIDAAMADNSDASYGTYTVAGSNIVLEMTTQALGANDVTKSVTPRLRAYQLAIGDTANADILSAGVPVATVAVPLTASAATLAGAAIAVNLSSAQVAALQFRLYSPTVGSTIRMVEAYCDLIWVAGAVTTITYPTGAPVLGVSTLTATWTSVVDSSADGSSRDRYRLKVFTAAQYGTGGFDPETSTAFYDSGIVVSTAQTQDVNALTNATTFRVFVKVGDSVNGVAHWGAWAGGAGSQFSTSYSTADILSVVGTPDNSNARISVVVTRVTAGPPPTWATVEVQRSTDAGASWLPVRAANGVAVSGTTFTIVDNEAPNGATVVYRARATYLNGGIPVTSAWVSSASTSWTAAADWLKHPSHPSLNRQVTIVANPPRKRRRRQGIHDVIGRSDSVVVSDVLNLPTGPLTFVTFTDADAVDLLALLAYDVLFLQTRPGARFGQKYIAIGDVPETPVVDTYNESTTMWPISWVEVLIPIDVGLS